MSSFYAVDNAIGRNSAVQVRHGREFLSWDETDPQSGLMLTRVDGRPILPEFTLARRRRFLAKRIFDVIVASLAILVLMPVFILVAIGIKLSSPGPVLFTQTREGLRGQTFRALKFRSMRLNACDQSGVAQTVKDDARVSRFGRFLRRRSIDELPQLFNVLRGEMSLVGPRPHVSGMRAGGTLYRTLVRYYDTRLEVVPGITGWAQANGLRGPTDNATAARARIDHDIAYIQNFSLWLDIKIILMTIQREILRGSGD